MEGHDRETENLGLERHSAKTVNICLNKVSTTGFTRGINNGFASLSCRMKLGDMFPRTPWRV